MSGSDLVSGTLDLLVLKTLAAAPLHGYAIGKSIKAASSEVLRVGENVLYPSLHRLEEAGDVEGRWGVTPTGRKARIYRLTHQGRARLDTDGQEWVERSRAALRILEGGA